MRKKMILMLCLALISTFSFAQEIKVINNSGEMAQFNLSDIANITFSPQDQSRDQDILLIHSPNGIYQLLVYEIDSLYFNDEGSIAFFETAGSLHQINLSEIDSLSFSSEFDADVYIDFAETTVSIVNSLEFLGVSVEVSGADVIVTSTADIDDINYVLSGATSDGMFKIYSENDFILTLDEVQITNQDGPAINIQADVDIYVELADGTTSILTDGATYADPPNGEDQKAAFFSEGQLLFSSGGSLIVNGQGDDQHGLGSDDYIVINDGNITIQSATKDGIHTNEGYFQNGGTVEITSNSDGIDAGDGPLEVADGILTVLNQADDTKGLKCDSEILITGGLVDLTIEGDQSKGLSAVEILLSGGELNIDTSGNVVLEASGSGYDPSYCVAIKADSLVQLNGCQVSITATGEAGRGIFCDGDISLLSGNLEIDLSGDGDTYTNELGEIDAYHSPCLKADGDISIIGGDYTLNNSGKGGKGIISDGQMLFGSLESIPVINITTTGQRIVIHYGGGGPGGGSGEYVEAKAISTDSCIVIENGDFTISSADDGIKSKESITINNGTLEVTNSEEGLEAHYITVNNGTITVAATDDGFNATLGTGAMYNDGSQLDVNGGSITVNMSGNDVDAMDSNGDITIVGGTVYLNFPNQPPSSGLDANGTVTIGGDATVYLNGVLYNHP